MANKQVNFYKGDSESYINSEKESGALYFLTDKGKIYLDGVNYSGGEYEKFIEITTTGNKLYVDHIRTPFSEVYLKDKDITYTLEISNLEEGGFGKILVHQTGSKYVVLSDGMLGFVDLPINPDTIALLSYNKSNGIIYVYTNTIIQDELYPKPQKITDFQVTYSDSTTCTVQWTAPYGNAPGDAVTEYDMRYSNSLVDADDPKVWSGMKIIPNISAPESPGVLQKMTIAGLTPSKEYYIYIKSKKINFGGEYTSLSSDFVYFKTLGSEDTSKAYRIQLERDSLYPQLYTTTKDENGDYNDIGRLIDEVEKNIFMPDGYPDTENKDYDTYWELYKYSRDTSPFSIIIDLYSTYNIDKLFIYSKSKPRFTVYGMKDLGYPWEKIGEINIHFNNWASLDFNYYQCRFINISFDLMNFASSLAEGEEGFPKNQYNETLEQIQNLLIYGRQATTKPEGIKNPLRRSTKRRTVDQFFCTNGHAYQPGRIHSMLSGEKVRSYIGFGQFAALYGTEDQYTTLADMRFRVNQIPWVRDNNGSREFLEDNLRNTYKKYGLKPYLTNTGVMDYCLYDRSLTVHNRPLDGYWYPGAWRPAPSRGVGGLTKYYGVTKSAEGYKTYSKMMYSLGAKYGKNKIDGTGMFYPDDESLETGLDLLSGLEFENEPDQNWSNWIGYCSPEEYAALASACTDGHVYNIADENGDNVRQGMKKSGILAIGAGLATVNSGYIMPAYLWWKSNRKDSSVPLDVFSVHMYSSTSGSQELGTSGVAYGIPYEMALERNLSGEQLLKLMDLRDRLFPDKEVWMTEFGWGESGGRDTSSKNQCYSIAGRKIGDWIIPDRHRADVKGSYIVRAAVTMMGIGIDLCNYYSTECEGNYFGTGKWDTGAGFEMFHWNDEKSDEPGAKVEAIKKYETTYDRGGFATTGIFGQLLGNGGYPISRAYWWIATMRNTLKGYLFTGFKKLSVDSRIIVACFRKEGEDKGAYVVYLNDTKNTGVRDVTIPLPNGVTTVTKVTTWVPDIPNPQAVPNTLGWDRDRTGLPTSRKERYTNGAWEVINYSHDKISKPSYTSAPASYPENPQEGDEITILPTTEENPYFPIVGPVNAKVSPHNNTLSARQWEQDKEDWQSEPELDENGNAVWLVKSDAYYSWRQVDALCDYIDYHPDGIHGAHGDISEVEIVRGGILTNITEFPEYFLFDGIPDPDYDSKISELSSKTINSSTIELWWNNNNYEDTGYQIFTSNLPESGYSLLKTVPTGVENKITISGLDPVTTYYYKVRPVKNDKLGTLSDYVSAKTFTKIEAPTNLRMVKRTATTIELAWDYLNEQNSDFLNYSIYRAGDNGVYSIIGEVNDRTITSYTDTGLATGHNYMYKVRVLGLNGQSDYSNELETRTSLPEEASPNVVNIMTDKIGSKISIEFDIPIGTVLESSVNDFQLTEDGNNRLIKSVSRDSANDKYVVLSINQDSLSTYDKLTDIRISYVDNGAIKSKYDVNLDSFSDVKVINIIGNFSNIEAIYNVNLTSKEDEIDGWNKLLKIGNAATPLSSIVDTYGRIHNISISTPSGSGYIWGSSVSWGTQGPEGIPSDVYKYCWTTGYEVTSSEAKLSRLVVSNLNNENVYTIKGFGGTYSGGASRSARIKANGAYSLYVEQAGNSTDYMVVENIRPINGEITIDLIPSFNEASIDYPILAYFIMEEYRSDTSPANTDLWINEATVLEDDGYGVSSSDITIHLSCIGSVTAYRIGETEDLSSLDWIDLTDSSMNIPYMLNDSYGEKTMYVQVMNLYNESNVKEIKVLYRDPNIPLVLKNIFINNDDSETTSREVNIFIEKEGTAIQYRLGETADLSSSTWINWDSGITKSTVPYTLSEGVGQKTVYCQLKNSDTESAIKVDTIELKNA